MCSDSFWSLAYNRLLLGPENLVRWQAGARRGDAALVEGLCSRDEYATHVSIGTFASRKRYDSGIARPRVRQRPQLVRLQQDSSSWQTPHCDSPSASPE